MFGSLGIPELILIFIVALLVFGPKRLPEIGRTLGKALGEFKKATDELKSNWDENLKMLKSRSAKSRIPCTAPLAISKTR